MSIIERNNNEEVSSEKDGFSGTPIQKFYAGETVFITGATGFLGKVLVEKLLRSCPDISTIYLLVRPKKGKEVDSRMDELLQNSLWDCLKDVQPNFREKVVPLNGDCGVEGLGLSDEDRDLIIRNTSIVFHVAATVRFDEKLDHATRINMRSTREIMDMCNRMGKLKSCIYVSTVYANCTLDKIDEHIYEYPVPYNQLINVVESLSADDFEEKFSKFSCQWPNTYTFTKAMAELLVKEKTNGLPIGIFRPAIVTSAEREPIPGWTDSLYGATGIVMAGYMGILKIVRCDGQKAADIVPVDLTVNALIASAWDVYTRTNRRDDSMLVYNYSSSADARISWNEFRRLSQEASNMYPAKSSLWYHSVTLVKNKFLFTMAIWAIHILPALLIDTGLMCIGRKPKAYKICKKIQKAVGVIVYFTLHEWEVTNYNVRKMWNRLDKKDQQLFQFSMKDFDWERYFRLYILGIRSHMLNESPETLAACKIRMNRLYWLHQAVKSVAVFGALFTVLKIFSAFY